MARIQISDLSASDNDDSTDGDGYLRDLTDTELNNAIRGGQSVPISLEIAQLAKSLGITSESLLKLISGPTT
jgi:hypothetical protein